MSKQAARKSSQKRSPFPGIIVAMFLAVAVVMLAIAAITAANAGRAFARETQAPGHVVDLAIRQSLDGTLFYRPVVAFALPDGARRTVQVAEENTDPAYRVDASVTVAYDPAQPDRARIVSTSSTFSRWILPLITAILGVAFLGATLFARSVLRSDSG